LAVKPVVHAEHVMGTVVSFDVRLDDEAQRAAMSAAVDDAVRWLHRVDEVFSTYRDDSQISRLGRGDLALADCDPDVAEVLDLCAQVASETRGYFSSMYAGRLDPSGLVKGWAVQRASGVLVAAGSRRHCVNGGGDMQVAGEVEPGTPWQIGIAHPLQREAYASVVQLRKVARTVGRLRGVRCPPRRSRLVDVGLPQRWQRACGLNATRRGRLDPP
jgi:thiamine biosynthesis lipoprotein